jgi:SAM-dependent methyltransferase
VIALDVFEHISDPMKAFAEVKRVLKPSGAGIITVPIDARAKKTKTIAKMENGKIAYSNRQAYHSDPLRPEGSSVFTEFGLDILDTLSSLGYDVSWDIYKTGRTRVEQRVLLLKK